jgi:translocation and assembly module TamB
MVLRRAQGRIDYRGGRGNVGAGRQWHQRRALRHRRPGSAHPRAGPRQLRGTANGIAFRLARPAEVVRAGKVWRLLPATILMRQGRIDVEGEYGDMLRLRAAIRNLDLSILRTFAPSMTGLGGTATGTIDYAGDAGIPTVNARIDIARFTRTGALVVSDPVDIAMLARLSDAAGDVRAVVRRGGGVVGRLQARLAPIAAGADGWSARLLRSPLSGGVRYAGPAEVLWTLTGIADQTVTGRSRSPPTLAGGSTSRR